MIFENEANQGTGNNMTEYTVSEISGALKRAVEDRFGYIRVKAELSGVKRVSSGHCYFALKDENAVMDGVMWRGNASRLSFIPEDGLEVVCSGKLTTYAARSKYQMVVDKMEPAGVGALMALLEDRKKKLAAEGLFDPTRKKPIPFLPAKIGVVTSPTGAVIRDILHRLADRFPSKVMVWPVLVQGEGAAEQVAQAITGFNAMTEDEQPDLLIVARGGGSVEDLWSFNEEIVVRAAAASKIPLISAVGHETDTTLIDYASDLRAPTPTAAAEKAVPVRADLEFTLADLGRRLTLHKSKSFDERKQALRLLSRALPSPKDILGANSQKLDDFSERLPMALLNVTRQKSIYLNRLSGSLSVGKLRQSLSYSRERLNGNAIRLEPSIRRRLNDQRDKIDVAGRMLGSLSYQRVLDRGYAVIKDETGNIVKGHSSLKNGDQGEIMFAGGSVGFIATDIMKIEGSEGSVQKQLKKKPAPQKKAIKQSSSDQGSLF
jgi:exodeoxyribonuclease VII large subunit